MPANKFQKMVFAFYTVIITVHAYVFYSLYVVNGNAIMAASGGKSVLQTINNQGGVYMLGKFLPIWAVILIEFLFAYTLEMTVGSPCSFKLAQKAVNPRECSPMIFESAIICSTVIIMCPAMSFIAAWLYYPYYMGFNLLTLLANWLKLVCFNLPFAFFTQLIFIQPLVRKVFKLTFSKNKTDGKAIISESVK